MEQTININKTVEKAGNRLGFKADLKVTRQEFIDLIEEAERGKKGLDLSGIQLSPHIDLRYLNLKGAKFNRATLEDVKFDGSDLRWADFSNANLKGTSFIGANLRESKYDGAIISFTNFERSDLHFANFNGVRIRDEIVGIENALLHNIIAPKDLRDKIILLRYDNERNLFDLKRSE